MNIGFISLEVSPYAKVGGLADVAGSLPLALRKLELEIKVLMPAYPFILKKFGQKIKKIKKPFEIVLNSSCTRKAQLYKSKEDTYFLAIEGCFEECTSEEKIYAQTKEEYLLFTKGIFESFRQLEWIPQVLHVNDWQLGFVPLLLKISNEKEFFKTSSVFTIHNLAYQGEFGIDVLDLLELPRSLFDSNLVECYGQVNFMKTGCQFADQVNTVSPTYADEILTPAYGEKLDGLMRYLHGSNRLSGIINGIDLNEFNPSSDPSLPYSYKNNQTKTPLKNFLRNKLGLKIKDNVPLVGMVTRLGHQKGFDLIFPILKEMLEIPMGFVVLGLGDPNMARQLHSFASLYPGQIKFIDRFDQDFAKQIYAGSDLFLMPSRFEPCGLGQMIAMRYGTIPVIRQTGGLNDTIRDLDNGFCFNALDSLELLNALKRAYWFYSHKDLWNQMVDRAMAEDSGWEKSAKDYVKLYEKAINSPRKLL